MIPESFIQELLHRIDIVDVVERYVPLKKAGANYTACCPFHTEKSPSFTVSPSKQFYHCFGCGAHGSAISFLIEYSGLGFIDAVEELARSTGLTVPYQQGQDHRPKPQSIALTETMAIATRYYRAELKGYPQAIEYLKSRGLTGEIAARFQLGYAPESWQNLATTFQDYNAQTLLSCGLVIDGEGGKRYDRFRDRIMFPIIDSRGNIIGFGGRVLGKGEPKYLNSPETPLFEKGRELYGLPQARIAIRTLNAVIVVEGYMDVVALAQHHVENCVATLGTATTPQHVQKLLRQADKIIFCFDGDNAGRKAAWRALESSLEQLTDNKAITFLFLPEGEDPDSFIRSHGAEAFRGIANQAMPLTEFLLNTLKTRSNPNTAEGRAQLVHEAKPLLQRLSAPLLRLQLVRAIAKESELEPTHIETACNLKPFTRTRTIAKIPRRSPSPLEKKLLLTVLHRLDLVSRIPSDVVPNEPGSAEMHIIKALVDSLEDGPLPTHGTGILLEHFRGSEHEKLLAEAIMELHEDYFDETCVEAVFNDTVDRLRLAQRQQEFASLQRKIMGNIQLSTDELQRYKELSSSNQTLRQTQA